MHLITRDELKARLDRGDDFDLLMAMGELAFRVKHIPASIYAGLPETLLDIFDP
jgi:hypothetical protein